MQTFNLIETFPILYGTEKNGKIKIWKACVLYDETSHTAQSTIEFGQIDGKHQTCNRQYDKGKNIGKKNETTPLEQAISETRRKWLDKKEKENYSEEKEDEKKDNKNTKDDKQDDKKFFPMLAHTYDPLKKKKDGIKYPCFVQPKLDGLRCIVYYHKKLDKVVFQSRTGAFFDTLEHIRVTVDDYLRHHPSIILDGELYTDQEVMPFEELAGLIKKKKLTEDDYARSINIHYHVYDMVSTIDPFESRFKALSQTVQTIQSPFLSLVRTEEASSFDEFRTYFSEFVNEGFEGIMLRNKNGYYQCNYRSNDLQKYKEFLEDEYTITGYKEGDGRDKGTVIWICKNDQNNEFSVRPRGTLEQRKEWFNNGKEFIGKKLTVIYQELSETGIPRFPVGKCIRDGF